MVLLAHAGLIWRSRWQADEYQDFSLLREGGLGYALSRFLGWAPRPWSEILLRFYGLAVNTLHRPLAGSFVATLWAGLGVACLAPAWFGASKPCYRWPRLLLGLAILALFLLGHPMSEVFFWPSGAAAYLPTLAAAALLFWCLSGEFHARGAAASLALAAGSSEVGLFLTVIFSSLVILHQARSGLRRLWWLAPGLAVALPVMLLLFHGRVGHEALHGRSAAELLHATKNLAGAPRTPFLNNMAASFAAALRDFMRGEAGFDGSGKFLGILPAGAAIFLGARWASPSETASPASGGPLSHFAAALVLASFCTIAAAYYQFGRLCCERHETMRACFLVLATISLGVWSAQWRRPRNMSPSLAAAAFLLPVLTLFAIRMPALVTTYALYPRAVQARAETWHSGLQTTTDAMTLFRGPDEGLITNGDYLAPGLYKLTPESPWYVSGILRFFHKKTLKVALLPP